MEFLNPMLRDALVYLLANNQALQAKRIVNYTPRHAEVVDVRDDTGCGLNDASALLKITTGDTYEAISLMKGSISIYDLFYDLINQGDVI